MLLNLVVLLLECRSQGLGRCLLSAIITAIGAAGADTDAGQPVDEEVGHWRTVLGRSASDFFNFRVFEVRMFGSGVNMEVGRDERVSAYRRRWRDSDSK